LTWVCQSKEQTYAADAPLYHTVKGATKEVLGKEIAEHTVKVLEQPEPVPGVCPVPGEEEACSPRAARNRLFQGRRGIVDHDSGIAEQDGLVEGEMKLIVAELMTGQPPLGGQARLCQPVAGNDDVETPFLERREELPRLRVPTLVMQPGFDDGGFYVDQGRDYMRNFCVDSWRGAAGTNATLEFVTVAKSRLFVMYDRPEEFDGLVERFLKRVAK